MLTVAMARCFSGGNGGFVDDIMCSRNETNGPESNTTHMPRSMRKKSKTTHMFRSVRPVATLGPFLTALISKGSLPEQEEEEN